MLHQFAINIDALNALYINNELFINKYLEEERIKIFKEYNIDPFSLSYDEDSEDFALLTSLNNYYLNTSIDTKVILSNYMVVAAFSYYEKTIKKILLLSNKFTKTELWSCFQEKKLIKLLKEKLGIDYNKLAHSIEVKELRLLNNIIKHSGLVNSELADLNKKWIKGKKVENTYKDFQRLSPVLVFNIKDLLNSSQISSI